LLLCRTLGRTLQELLDTMSVTEFQLWAAEFELAPWAPLAAAKEADPVEFFGRFM